MKNTRTEGNKKISPLVLNHLKCFISCVTQRKI